MKVKPFSTARLDLKAYSSADEEALFALRSNPQVNEYTDRPKPKDLADVQAFIEKIRKGIERNEMISWGIYLKGSSAMIGSIGYWQYNAERTSADIGYELMPEYWRQGIMQEAFSATLPHFFNEMNFKKMEAWVNVANYPSIQFLEKNNFQKVRLVPKGEAGDATDMFVYALKK